MQIPSPYAGRPFKSKDSGYGYHYETTHQQQVLKAKPINPHRPDGKWQPVLEPIDIPDNPEVIDLATGQSNSKYYQPDMILNPEGCRHEFTIIDMGKREVMCTEGCEYVTSFHPARNFVENEQGAFIVIKKRYYPIIV